MHLFIEEAGGKDQEPLVGLLEGVTQKVEERSSSIAVKKLLKLVQEITDSDEGLPVPGVVQDTFIALLDNLPEKDSSASVALEVVRDNLRSTVCNTAKNLSDEGSLVLMQQVLKNSEAIEKMLNATDIEMDFAVIKAAAGRAAAVVEAYGLYSVGKTKPNVTAFNKAVVNWLQYKLPLDRQTVFHIDFLRHCLQGMQMALTHHSELVKERVAEAEKELNAFLFDAQKICLGTKDGTAWKASGACVIANRHWGHPQR